MSQFAFTFGLGYDLHDKFVVVEADTEAEARETFVTAREGIGVLEDSDRRWAFCYPVNERWDIIVKRHHLTETSITTPINWRDTNNPIE